MKFESSSIGAAFYLATIVACSMGRCLNAEQQDQDIPRFGINNPTDHQVCRDLGVQIVKIFPINWSKMEPFAPQDRLPALSELSADHLGIDDLPVDLRKQVAQRFSEIARTVQRRDAAPQFKQDHHGRWHLLFWHHLDRHVRPAQAAGLNVMFNMTFNSLWASERKALAFRMAKGVDGYNAPLKDTRSAEDLTFFVRVMVERYDGDGVDDMPGLARPITYWEDGNEYNVPRFWQGSNEQYLTMWKAFSEGVRTASPNTRVVANGINSLEEIRESVTADGVFSPKDVLRQRIVELKNDPPPGLRRKELLPIANKLIKALLNQSRPLSSTQLQDLIQDAGLPDRVFKSLTAFLAWRERSVRFFYMLLDHPELYDVFVPHFYSFYQEDPARISDDMTFLFREMDKRGYRKPVMVLEVSGAHLGPGSGVKNASSILRSIKAPSDPDFKQNLKWYRAQQASELIKVHGALFANGVDGIVWYQFRDSPETSPWASSAYGIQGLIALDRRGRLDVKKPAFHTYKLMTKKLRGFEAAVPVNRDCIKFTFKDHEPIYVIWTEDRPTTVSLAAEIASPKCRVTPIVTELDRHDRPILVQEKIVPTNAVPISQTPVFLECL